MKVDKEALLKQHFWILLSLVALLPLICLIVLWTAAADTIEVKKKDVTATKDKLKKIQNAKNTRWLDALGERLTKVDSQKDKIWKVAWDKQADMIYFPENLTGAQEVNDKLSFGDALSENFRIIYDRTPNLYKSQYDANLQLVEPVKSPTEGKVQFKGNAPESVVPVVFSGTFEKKPPDATELWLIQEDLAIQRELLRIIKDTNDMIATFHKVPGAAKPDKAKGEIDHQVFTNANFKLDLVLAQEKGKGKVFRCVLTNITKRRLPVSGIGFVVNVKGVGLEGFIADGEPLAPNASMVVKQKEKGGDQEKDWELLSQGAILQGEVLESVMQVFDWRTVPIKRIDAVRLGVQSHRTQGALAPPAFDKAAAEAAAQQQAAAQPAGGDTGGAGPGGGDPRDMMDRMNKVRGVMGGMGGFSGGKSDQTKNGIEKNRYMSSSKQVRRLPVALAVVMDQAYIDDFLTVVANSKLRIQTTQVYWQRFHDDIKPTFPEESKEAKPGEGPGAAPGRPTPPSGIGGKFGKGLMGGGDEGVRPRPGMQGGAATGAPNAKFRAEQMAQIMNNMKGKMMGMGGMGGGAMPGANSPNPSSAAATPEAEPEEESNLVEVAFYGIASLYERFPPKKEGAEVASTTPAQ